MPRKLVHHAALDAVKEHTRNALAALTGGLCGAHDAPNGCDPKVIYDGFVSAIVRIVFLFLAGELRETRGTWHELVAAFRQFDAEMPPGETRPRARATCHGFPEAHP